MVTDVLLVMIVENKTEHREYQMLHFVLLPIQKHATDKWIIIGRIETFTMPQVARRSASLCPVLQEHSAKIDLDLWQV